MAKSTTSKGYNGSSVNASAITKPKAASHYTFSPTPTVKVVTVDPLYDARRYAFAPVHTARARLFSAAPPMRNVNLHKLTKSVYDVKSALFAASPERAAICARRKIRREVLLALRLGKKGAGARRRHNHRSRVKC